jgi:copper chaperone
MQPLQFKTNIKCTGCLAKVSPYLNETLGEDNWEIDLHHPDKLLTVIPEDNLSKEMVQHTVREAGYTAEPIAQ